MCPTSQTIRLEASNEQALIDKAIKAKILMSRHLGESLMILI